MLVSVRIFLDPFFPRSSAHHMLFLQRDLPLILHQRWSAAKCFHHKSITDLARLDLVEAVQETARHKYVSVLDRERNLGHDPRIYLVGKFDVRLCTANYEKIAVEVFRKVKCLFLIPKKYQVVGRIDLCGA